MINVPYYIARRYFRTRYRKNVIHLITWISIIGIMITTAALYILLAAFNGIESMVEELYSEFDSNLSIRSEQGKTFSENTLNIKAIEALPEVSGVSRGIEEIVILKHEKNWVNASLYGVDHPYLEMISANNHLVDGRAELKAGEPPTGIIGASLLDKLGGFITRQQSTESIQVYSPRREGKISRMNSLFRSASIQICGRLNYNREVNEEAVLVPIDFARELLDYDQAITVLYVNIKTGANLEDVRQKIARISGKAFQVKTQFEKNALIYQTSRTEKVIVVCILVFIFILAIFNLVASMTMLFIEKEANLDTLRSYGADRSFIFRIFFYEGMLISGAGIVLGTLLGLGIVALQHYAHLVILPNSGEKAFPMDLTMWNVLMILAVVFTISIFATRLTIYFLLKTRKTV